MPPSLQFHPYNLFPELLTVAPLHLYVRAVDGDDSNPGTAALPLATLTRAEELIPYNVAHPVAIHVGPHVGSGYVAPRFRERMLTKDTGSQIYMWGDGGGGGTDGTTELLGTTASLAGSDEFTVISSGLTPDALNGATIEILSGAAAGCRRTIRNNTVDTIYPCVAFKAAVAVTDTFRVFDPAIKIEKNGQGETGGSYSPLVRGTGQSTVQLAGDPRAGKVWFINLELVDQVYDIPFITFDSSGIVMLGVKFNGTTGGIFGADTTVLAGLEHYKSNWYMPRVTSPVADLGVGDALDWWGWGISSTGDLFVEIQHSLRGYLVADGILSLGGLEMLGGGSTDSYWVYPSYSATDATNFAAAWNSVNPIRLSGNPSVVCEGSVYLSKVELSGAGDGVFCKRGKVILGSYNTGNVDGIGLRTKEGGTILLDTAPGITGTVADFSEDDGVTLRANAALALGACFIDTAWLSKIGRTADVLG